MKERKIPELEVANCDFKFYGAKPAAVIVCTRWENK